MSDTSVANGSRANTEQLTEEQYRDLCKKVPTLSIKER
jgi:hypothetical protein